MKIPARRQTSPVPLFQELPEGEIGVILAKAALRKVRAGTILCRQGEPAAHLFLMRNGHVRFVRATSSGDEVLLRLIGPGGCFGIASLLAGPARYAGTARTTDETRLYVWEADTIQQTAAAHPRLAQNALGVVLQYLKDYIDRHIALVSKTAEQRLARTLTALGATNGRVLPTGVEIDITNQDLGSLADVGIYTVSRQLKNWEREGHLVKHRGGLLVRHPEALLHE